MRIRDHKGGVIGIGRAQYEKTVAERHLEDRRYKPLVHYDYLFIYPEVH